MSRTNRSAKWGCLLPLGLLGLTLLGFWLKAEPSPPMAWFEDAPRPLLLAHQGGEKEWPSNTMYAFERAYEVGSDVLDLDLLMTKDRVLVLIHDTTVDRTTDGQGAVIDLTWEEISQLDAAYHFTLDGETTPLRGQGIRIPRLAEVLETFPEWRLQIEVKQAPLEIADELAKLLKDYGAEDRVLLSCFDETMMAELRRASPKVASSATPKEIRALVFASWLRLESLISPKYSAFQVPLRYDGIPLVTRRTVQAAHNRGIWVLPWTLDEEAEVEICRQARADGFNTNLPTKMEGVRKNWDHLEAPLFSN